MKCIVCKDKEALFCEDCCPHWRHKDKDFVKQLVHEYKQQGGGGKK